MSRSTETSPVDTLFYDGACALCSTEIRHLNRLKDSTLQLIDIHAMAATDFPASVNKLELMTRLHLRSADGLWLTGLDATVRAWQHTKFGWLLLPLRWPIFKQISDWCYNRWANNRACKIG
ncbi:thiol-disulfide oxidoreductase DCC family protein [Arenicella xantha]|uniref:Putative DCC family thiol-disulfide oxidoreductase YuxK n=1 Tax=Arenicella xantha TaxID=644221 RepID=A0A395JKS4_9GAMM|nr:DUF393 domain-containing protein [Arenicella xantha]RBP48312.1 putative DCC family thiol-disulfide oxidoreductase YuxK [Arenicella xantha]